MSQNNFEPEINFKDVIQNPKRQFGFIYPYFLVIMIALGMVFLFRLDVVSMNEAPGVYPIVTSVIPDIEKKKGGLVPSVDLNQVKVPTKELLAQGKELFQKNCSSCHGEQGKGDGVAGVNLNPKPRNFHLATGWTNGPSIEMMYKTLQEGILTRGMAAYEYLPPFDRIALIHYVRSFAKHFPEITDEKVDFLNKTYKLSENILVPNKIPRVKAALLLENEMQIKNEKIKNELKGKPELNNILLKITDNPAGFVYSFARDSVFCNYDEFVKTLTIMNNTGSIKNLKKLNSEEISALFNYVGNKKL